MKKFCLFLCLILMVSLLGCVKPDEESSNSSSTEEESSVLEESSKLEESSVPAESSVLEESSVLDGSSTPEESSAPEESFVDLPEPIDSVSASTPAAAYLEVIEDFIDKYGEGRIENGGYVGLVIVKLIDFDNDCQDELYCAYSLDSKTVLQSVYSYSDGCASHMLTFPSGYSDNGTPQIKIMMQYNDSYILCEDGDRSDFYGLVSDMNIVDGTFCVKDSFRFDGYVWNGTVLESTYFYNKLRLYREIFSVDFQHPDEDDGPAALEHTSHTIDYLHKSIESTSAASAYLAVIQHLTDQFGEGRIEDGKFAGLAMVKLIDFDNDGQDELYCVPVLDDYMPDGYVYSYDGSLHALGSTHVGTSNRSTPISVFRKKDGITYIWHTDGAQDHLYTVQDGELVSAGELSKFWDASGNRYEPGEYDLIYHSYETLLTVDYQDPERDDGPELLANTRETIEFLKEAAAQENPQ